MWVRRMFFWHFRTGSKLQIATVMQRWWVSGSADEDGFQDAKWWMVNGNQWSICMLPGTSNIRFMQTMKMIPSCVCSIVYFYRKTTHNTYPARTRWKLAFDCLFITFRRTVNMASSSPYTLHECNFLFAFERVSYIRVTHWRCVKIPPVSGASLFFWAFESGRIGTSKEIRRRGVYLAAACLL